VVDSSVTMGKKASILDFLLTVTIVLIGSLYLTIASYSRDLLWFWPKFEVMPAQVIIQCYGSKQILEGNSQEAEEITTLVNDQISGDKRFDPLSLTIPTYEYYQNNPDVVILELVYSSPVRIHLPNMFFTNITSLIIPLEGRYASSFIIFGLIDGVPAGGSFHINSNQAIMDYLDHSALCSKP
jgi:hypothetical protein